MTVISLQGLLTNAELSSISGFFEDIQPSDGISQFKTLRQIKRPLVRGSLSKLVPVVEKIHEIYFDTSVQLSKIWFQRTSNHSPDGFSEKTTPFLPHIDVHRMWKAMIYVDDINVENGPFMSSYLDPNLFEEGRVSASIRIETGQSNPQEEWSALLKNLTIADFTPVVGQAGTVHVFDTNTPHLAGTPKGQKFRRIVRLDFQKRK